jgi:probable selenium-dependent hydroxylase accessory protein YqeC
VIPGLSTTVIVVMGADALMSTLEIVAHRVDRVAALTGLSGDVVITPHVAAEILLHPNGGLKDIPEGARVEMAISKVTSENQAAAKSLASILEQHPGVESSVLVWSSPVTR